jgi:hypothetical protein
VLARVPSGPTRVRRAIVVALAGVPVVCALTLWGDMVVGGVPWGSGFPPMGPTLLLLLLVGGNALVGRTRPGARLGRGELLAIYAVWAVVAGLPGRGMLMFLLPNITAQLYYERAARAALFGLWVPPRLVPGRLDAVRALYEGLPEGGVDWGTWVGPLLWWSALYMALWLVPLGFSLLLGPAWAREERLAFPAAEIPLAITEDADRSPLGGLPRRGGLWRSLAFWIGVGVPVLVHGINALHAMNPLLPGLPLADVNLDAALADPPWSALRPLRLSLFPSLVGILYLAPVDLLFSLWFFFVLGRLLRVVGELGGLTEPGAPFGASIFPYTEAQGAGAFLAMALWLLWIGRRPLLESVRGVVTRDAGEAARCRWGWLALLTGGAGLLLWARGVGWSLPFAAAFFGLLLANALVLARLVAEGGMLWPLGPIGPEATLLTFTGSAHLAPATLTIAALQFQHGRDPRGWLAPHFFQGQRLCEAWESEAHERGRRPSTAPGAAGLAGLWLAALLLALAVTLPLGLAVITRHGGLGLGGAGRWAFTRFANEPFARLAAWLQEPTEPNVAGAAAFGVGAVVTLALAVARVQFSWWPFHPLGYALSGTPEQLLYAQMAPSFLLAWLFKQVTLRWGGLPLYRALRPAAIGLVLGDFVMGALGTVSTALTGISAYPIWPG